MNQNAINLLTLTIPARLLPELDRRIKRIEKQAKALNPGAQGWSITYDATKPRPQNHPRACGVIAVCDVMIHMPALQIGEWKVIGRARLLNYGKEGNATVERLGADQLPKECWQVSNLCDHCGWSRPRKAVYVLAKRGADKPNLSDSTLKRVGHSCLQKMLPGVNLGLVDAVEALARWGQGGYSKTKKAQDLAPTFPIMGLLTLAHDTARGVHDQTFSRWQKLPGNRGLNALVESHTDLVGTWDEASIVWDWAQGPDITDKTEYERNVRALAEQQFLTAEEMKEHREILCGLHRAFQSHLKGWFRKQMDAWQAQRDELKAAEDAKPQGSRTKRLGSKGDVFFEDAKVLYITPRQFGESITFVMLGALCSVWMPRRHTDFGRYKEGDIETLRVRVVDFKESKKGNTITKVQLVS